MNIGCIIRSVGERTERLCIESVERCLPSSRIHILKNVYPFHNAVKQMFNIAKKHKYDWYLGLDADVILIEHWLKRAIYTVENLQNQHYKIEFPLFDRFLKQTMYGVHFYNNLFTEEANTILNETKDNTKPEGNIRHKISCPQYLDRCGHIGYHGYNQYYRDYW